jgi:hypothetical protein
MEGCIFLRIYFFSLQKLQAVTYHGVFQATMYRIKPVERNPVIGCQLFNRTT